MSSTSRSNRVLIPALLVANSLAAFSLFGRSGSEAEASEQTEATAVSRTDASSAPKITVDSFPQLTIGAEGEWVGFLQQALNRYNYQLEIDQKFGKQTLQALQNLKDRSGLAAHDIVDRNTWAVLTPEYLPVSRTPSGQLTAKAETSEQVSTIESSLDPKVRQAVRDSCERVCPGDLGFRTAMMFVVEWEGGYTVDHAGATQLGVTKPFYEQYLKSVGLKSSQAKAIRDLTLDDAVTIYAHSIWGEAHCKEVADISKHSPENIPENSTAPVALVLANGAINYGSGRAFEFLRCAVNETGLAELAVERSFDHTCLRAIANVAAAGKTRELVDNFLEREEAHYRTLGEKPKFEKYLDGWLNRHNSIVAHVNNLNRAGMPQGLLSSTVESKPTYGCALRSFLEAIGIE